jgi:hypothetical protein
MSRISIGKLERQVDELMKLATKQGYSQPALPTITMRAAPSPILGERHWAHDPTTDTLHFTLRLDNKG